MHAEVYANRRAPAQTEQGSALKAADNYLNLLPEHRNEINNQWLSHVVTQRISGNGMRILHSIYRHTIGFNKQKDDLSGKRLQQISYIRADHANHTLHALEADHAIICQDGRYGQIVSINFDFASWGKKHCEEQQITPKFISDPRYLLPKRYRDEPIDSGNIIGANLSDVLAENSADSSPQTPAAPIENLAPPTAASSTKTSTSQHAESNIETLNTVKQTAQMMEHLLTKLDHLEKEIHTLQQDKKPRALSPPTLKINTRENKAEIVNLALTTAQQSPSPRIMNIPDSTPQNHFIVENTETSTTPTPSSPSTPTENSHSQIKKQTAKPSTHHSVNNSANTQDTNTAPTHGLNTSAASNTVPPIPTINSLEQLHYPNTLDQHSRNALGHLLLKAGKHAQNILDLLALRLENTQNPIQDIALYCASLVRKARNNQLDLDALNAYRASQKPAPSPKEKQIRQLQKEYQSAHADYQHFKRINKLQAKNRQCSVEKYLEESGMQKFWQGLVERLEQVKQQIDQARGIN